MAAFPFDIPCPLRVKINKITLNNSKGSFSIINKTVPACIDALQNSLSFTNDMMKTLHDITEHPTDPAYSEQTYPASYESLIGNMTIELEGGYKTTISHQELISQERGALLNDVGQYGVINASNIQIAVASGQNDYGVDFGVLLGGVFLTSTYLFIDNEREIFGLAPVVNERPRPDIRGVCSQNTTVPIRNGTTVPTGNPANGTGTSSLSADSRIGLGVGLGVGIPTVILAAAGVWLQWYRR
jgi:hypothetical protein